MQRREFLRNSLVLGTTGLLMPMDAIASGFPGNKTVQLRLLQGEAAHCSRCQELANHRTQAVCGIGNPDAEIMFLGEAPGANEDKQGEPFVGRAGQLLNEIISEGLKLRRKDVYICNVLCCRPPKNRTPLPNEAANCRPFLDQALDIVKPKFICCLGAVVAQTLLGTTDTLQSLRGKVHNYNGISVVCTYHPASLLRNPDMKKEAWSDIQFLLKKMGR